LLLGGAEIYLYEAIGRFQVNVSLIGKSDRSNVKIDAPDTTLSGIRLQRFRSPEAVFKGEANRDVRAAADGAGPRIRRVVTTACDILDQRTT